LETTSELSVKTELGTKSHLVEIALEGRKMLISIPTAIRLLPPCIGTKIGPRTHSLAGSARKKVSPKGGT
jgi:hypothetical protein